MRGVGETDAFSARCSQDNTDAVWRSTLSAGQPSKLVGGASISLGAQRERVLAALLSWLFRHCFLRGLTGPVGKNNGYHVPAEEFRWATAVVTSRSLARFSRRTRAPCYATRLFDSLREVSWPALPATSSQACAAGNGDRVKYLVPVIDMANHDRLSPHAVRVAKGGEAFEVVVGTDVAAGEEVTTDWRPGSPRGRVRGPLLPLTANAADRSAHCEGSERSWCCDSAPAVSLFLRFGSRMEIFAPTRPLCTTASCPRGARAQGCRRRTSRLWRGRWADGLGRGLERGRRGQGGGSVRSKPRPCRCRAVPCGASYFYPTSCACTAEFRSPVLQAHRPTVRRQPEVSQRARQGFPEPPQMGRRGQRYSRPWRISSPRQSRRRRRSRTGISFCLRQQRRLQERGLRSRRGGQRSLGSLWR